MDLEFITKWIPVVHKIKICELSDCGIMVKIIRLLICTKYFSFKISYDTFDIIAPSKSLIKRTHHYIYFQYLLTYSILKSDSPSYIVRHPCKGGRYYEKLIWTNGVLNIVLRLPCNKEKISKIGQKKGTRITYQVILWDVSQPSQVVPPRLSGPFT